MKKKTRFSSKNILNEAGVTLIELVILIIILSIIVPVMLKVIGQMGIHHFQNEGIYRSISFANTKMEEIVAFKNLNEDWVDTINNFAGSEDLSGNFSRTVTITPVKSWINSGSVTKDAYEVKVSVKPPLGVSYSLTVIFAEE